MVCPAQQTLHSLAGGWIMEALPSRLSFPSLPWCRFYGRHMETVSIYPAPPGCCCTLCSSERKPWIPCRVISEAACKAASCFAGSVWALLHHRGGSVTICANRSSWFVCLSSGWATSLILGVRVFLLLLFYILIPVSSGASCSSSSSSSCQKFMVTSLG